MNHRFAFLAFTLSASLAQADWLVQQRREGKDVKILSVKPAVRTLGSEQRTLKSIPEFLIEGPGPRPSEIPTSHYEEIQYSDQALPQNLRDHAMMAQTQGVESWPGSELRTLVQQGPPANRINLTIVGDGYTAQEKEKFFADAKRITDDMFTGHTFASYLPLFNVYAVFVPSQQSGLTDGSDRRNTALGLYRSPAGSKRGVMPGNTAAAERAIALAPATDYPILIANDDYYGGLGGRYAITTRSLESGTVVLRHELGHNFGNVGEEYDGGYVYSGANASHSSNVPWQAWIEGRAETFEGRQLTGDYVWQSLKDSPFRSNFHFPAGDYTFGVEISSVGWSHSDDVGVFLNGQRQEIQGLFTRDRSFFKLPNGTRANAGANLLEIRDLSRDGDNVLAFANGYAFPPGYDFSEDRIAAFATFDDRGRKSYRPTHESCLMRNMRLTKFCSVDQENMWARFLSRVDLVDGVRVAEGKVQLQRVPLPGVEVRWFRVDANGRESEMTELRQQESWSVPAGLSGNARVKVSYRTPEVRSYTPRFESSKDFRI